MIVDRRGPGRPRHRHFLAQQSKRFVIVDAATSGLCVARSLGLAPPLHPTPVRQPPRPSLPGDPEVTTQDEVIAYLEKYARDLRSAIELSSRVRSVKASDAGLRRSGRPSIEADQVVVATGPYQLRRTEIADELGSRVFQTSQHRLPESGRRTRGTVLVVGGGNTGFQIAEELSPARRVHFSVGTRQSRYPYARLWASWQAGLAAPA